MGNSSTPHILVKPRLQSPTYHYISPADAGWDSLHFCARRLNQGEEFHHATDDNECVLVVLGGVCSVKSTRGEWDTVGQRSDVFRGMPQALYLPRGTKTTVTAISTELDIAMGWCRTDQDHPPRLITPGNESVEIRGGGNATRQINSILPPGFDCHRLVAVEVYTPPGNWSSYPPHKHDIKRLDGHGNVLEAALEEIYFYKVNPPEGFALQRIYTGDGSLDVTVAPHDCDVVLVPQGYHPVAAAPGYCVYYLNILAGNAQSLAATDDPAHSWVKQSWPPPDPRVPVVGSNKKDATS